MSVFSEEPPYATGEQLIDYLREDGVPTAVLARTEGTFALLVRAARDVDRVIGGPIHPTGRHRLDPSVLTPAQREALARATCAQASFLLEQRPRAMIGADPGLQSVGDLTFSPRPVPRIGARVAEELAGFGLLARSHTAPQIPGTSEDAA